MSQFEERLEDKILHIEKTTLRPLYSLKKPQIKIRDKYGEVRNIKKEEYIRGKNGAYIQSNFLNYFSCFWFE